MKLTNRQVVLSLILSFFVVTLWHRFIALAAQQQIVLPVAELRLPTNDLRNPHSPFWLSNELIGFVRETDSNPPNGALYIYNVKTKEIRKILDKPVHWPTFVPKLNRISFSAVGKDGFLILFTISPAGADLREHDFDGAVSFSPSWSPDARRVVFEGTSYDADLLIADVYTGKIESPGDLGRVQDTNGTEAGDWSPNGNEIVYVGWDKTSRNKDGGYEPRISRLYKYDLQNRIYRRLTGGEFQDRSPAHSPDGSRIVFISNRSRNRELWTMSSQGNALRRLTDMVKLGTEATIDKPSWSPDQRRIAFAAAPNNRYRRGGYSIEGSKIWILDFRQK